MLLIRDAQQAVLKREVERKFESEAVGLVASCWSDRHAALGEEGTRLLVREAMTRAAAWEITAPQDVLRFINVTVALGLAFDQDARLAWARGILNDRSLSPSGRVSVLCTETSRHLEESKEVKTHARE